MIKKKTLGKNEVWNYSWDLNFLFYKITKFNIKIIITVYACKVYYKYELT